MMTYSLSIAANLAVKLTFDRHSAVIEAVHIATTPNGLDKGTLVSVSQGYRDLELMAPLNDNA